MGKFTKVLEDANCFLKKNTKLSSAQRINFIETFALSMAKALQKD